MRARPMFFAVLVTATMMPSSRWASAAKGASDDALIGYVNIQRAIVEVEEGKRAKEKLKATFDVKQKALSDKESELKKMKDAIEKESVVKDDAATRQKKAEFQTKLLELQQVFMKEQQELQAEEAKALSGITEKMKKVIQEIGEQGGYTLILEIQDSRLLFAKPHLDLTNEVIRKYNARNK
jgi:outer membrane protein